METELNKSNDTTLPPPPPPPLRSVDKDIEKGTQEYYNDHTIEGFEDLDLKEQISFLPNENE